MFPHKAQGLPALPLAFVRHGATEPNLRGLRCGGEIDVPLTDTGRRQARATGEHLRNMNQDIGVIVSSDLQRTRETAAIIGRELGVKELLIEPGFCERHLGEWNLTPIVDSQPALEVGATPPGGESQAVFFERIRGTLFLLLPLMHRRPLLVASRGVARALGHILAQPTAAPLSNGELVLFDLAGFHPHQTESRAA